MSPVAKDASEPAGVGPATNGHQKNPKELRLITQPQRDELAMLLETVQSVKRGNFTVRFPVSNTGLIGKIGAALNDIIEMNENFADELVRVSQIVGQEGRMTERVSIGPAKKGAWATSVNSVNALIGDLVQPTNEVARVITSVAKGDLSQKMSLEIQGRPVKGEFFRIGTTVNAMVDQLSSFASEVTRVAKEVGTEGKLGGQAEVKGVSGVWKDLTDNVNQLAGNLTNQVRNIAKVTTAVAKGDLSQKITVDVKGEILELKNTINTMVDQLSSFAAEVTRVAKEVGTEGKLGGQAEVKGVSGTWKDLTDNVNFMAGNLTKQVRGIIKVVTAVANGDLNQKFVLEAKGEVAALADTINSMTDTLRTFADQVTTVAREVGIEGKLGGQAKVPGASGTWKDLTDNVNQLAGNLTNQVRNIAKVTTAVAKGDLSQKITVDVKGEILELKNTINIMVDQLSSFAAEVTRVAKEVGTEGKLGGQADVKGVSGVWKDLTDNVNQLAGNLTTQVRAIAEVATAVTKGDLTRYIAVQAQGEVAALKDNINQMIGNLKDTTKKNQEQDWLKTHIAKFTEMMQGQRSIVAVAQLIMSELTPLVGAFQGTFFIMGSDDETLSLIASYAFPGPDDGMNYRLKQGLVGQCAFEKKRILLTQVPDNYAPISSSLVESRPRNVIVLPVLFEGDVKAVLELASFQPFNENILNFLNQLMDNIGVILNMIFSIVRQEELLQELKRSNTELEAQAKELNDKAKLLEVKNTEVELASRSLEEKAEQLSLISKYKSEFLANMSHELRTPLNSLLLLSKTLANNKDNNLSPEQVQFSKTIYTSGCDLLSLINEILDLSKVEAGKMPIEPGNILLQDVKEHLEQTFRPVAEMRGLDFSLTTDELLPPVMFTDVNRLQQILKNLLSNAFKFTEKGRVSMRIASVKGRAFRMETLNGETPVLAFSVQDTGIGIPKDKQELIFEAFQQADGTTSRKYGGTGLGLTISREIARLLGGMIEVQSTPGEGSTFTLYLPLRYGNVEFRSDQPQPELIPATTVPPLPDDANFDGKTVLVVDDDRRNIFAITTVLEARGLRVLHAENGRTAVKVVQDTPDIDLVLMDIMMPEMDGIEAIQTIRTLPHLKNLPIISLTAKAMKGDREKCFEAGASDYVTKPVDPDNLLALIYVWLQKRQQMIATSANVN